MPKKYEALFIFSGSVKEDALDKVLERTNAEIERFGGTIENTEVVGRRQFARVMAKRDNGFYVKIRFAIEPSQIEHMYARFKLNDDCFRLQIVLRNERVEAAKAIDDARRSAYKASVEAATEKPRTEETTVAATENSEAEMPADGDESDE